jgi:hypothetical protein
MAKADMGGLFVTFLLMVIGLALTPTVATSVAAASVALAAYPAAVALCDLVPLFWVIIIVAIGVAAVYVQLKGKI